jgi:amino-acid N-acetyltransferase
MLDVEIRPATADDRALIRQMVLGARLDPTSLNWRHFLVAERDQQPVGIGQVKQLPGCRELGSLVVAKEYRRQGIARQIITALEAKNGLPLYLLCEARLGPFYEQFGYQRVGWWSLPLVLRAKLTPAYLLRLFGIPVWAMIKPNPLATDG